MSQSTPPNHANKLTDSGDLAHSNHYASDSFEQDGLVPDEIKHVTNPGRQETNRRLIVSLNGEIVREHRIGSGDINIGRKHGNKIQLNDLTLSGRHALITAMPDYVFVEDLGSTNGTMVNGNHVKKIALEHGDIIQVGHHQLTYLCEDEAKYEPTMFVKAEYDETQFVYVDGGEPADIVKGLPLAGLRTIGSSSEKPLMELRKTYNTIGFQGKCMALITRSTEGYTITAVIGTRSRRSMDIAMLNGHPMDTDQHLLEQDDIISIAGFEIQFYFLS